MAKNDALRRQAEALARENAAPLPKNIAAMSPEEIGKTLHELHVHQIELELQNEELRRTQTELETSRARYFDLYDLAPVGYCTLSQEGLILEANLTAATLLGVTRGRLVGRPLTRFIFAADQEIYYRNRNQLFETRKSQAYELRMLKKDGAVFWAQLEATIAQAADGAPVGRIVLSDISARQQAEAALRDSTARYQLLFEHAHDAIFIENDADDILDVNQRACDLLGYTRAELLALKLTDLQAPEVRGPIGQTIQAELARHSGAPFEAVDLRRDGTRVPVEVTVTTLRDRPLVFSIVRDISQRKQAEAALRESEHQLRLIADNIPAVVNYVSAQDLRYRFINRVCADLFGISPEYAVGKRVSEILGQAAFARALPYINRVRAGESLMYESLIPLRGEQRWFSTSYTPEFNEQGAVENIIVLAIDITERKQAAEQLQRYAFIANAATEAMTLINRQHVFETVNDAYCRAQGRSRAELIGHSLAEVWGATRYHEKIRPYLEQCFAGHIVRYEDTFPFEDGAPRYYQMGMYPYSTAPGGPVTYAVVVTFDITERQRAEESLRASNAELQIRNGELDAFAEMVAHDLKNPLSTMIGYAELLINDFSALPPDAIRQALMTISRIGRKADDIILSLLLLAHIRKQDVQATPLDMARLIDEVTLRLTDSIRTSGADLHVPDCAGWPIALGYAPWIEEIWANYLSNALKYGGPQPRIELSAARQPDGFIRFNVRDYGPGLTPDQQQRLFEPFERLGQTRIKGHGLGLSVVRRIIGKLGGQAGVDSQPGMLRGSAFYFTLPAA